MFSTNLEAPSFLFVELSDALICLFVSKLKDAQSCRPSKTLLPKQGKDLISTFSLQEKPQLTSRVSFRGGDASLSVSCLSLLWLYISCGGGLFIKSCLTPVTPWTVACQVPQSMEFSKQEYWRGLPFPTLGWKPEIKPRSPALQMDSLPSEPPGKQLQSYNIP